MYYFLTNFKTKLKVVSFKTFLKHNFKINFFVIITILLKIKL